MNIRLAFSIIFVLLSIALMICAFVAYRSKKDIGKPLCNMLVAIIPPIVGNFLIVGSTSKTLATVGCYLYYVGIDFTVFQALRFAMSYCKLTYKNEKLRLLILSLLGIDVIQILANTVFHHCFGMEETELYGSVYYRMIPYLPQNLHRVLVYLLLAGILGIYLNKMFFSPRMHSWRYATIFFTLLGVITWCTFYVISRTPLDRSMIGYGVFGLLTFYFSLYYKPTRLIDRLLLDISSELPDAIYFFNDNDECIWANKKGLNLLGINEGELENVRKKLEPFFSSENVNNNDNWSSCLIMNDNDDKKYYSLERRVIRDNKGRVGASFLNIRDDTEMQINLHRESYNARHDNLTDLYTKDHLYERIEELLEKNPDQKYSLVFMNICNFKLINDIFGKDFGDEVLKQVASLLRKYVPHTGVYGRIGGDTFGVFVPKGAIDMELVKKLLSGYEVSNGDMTYKVQIHLGIYETENQRMDVSSMFDRARIAEASIDNNFTNHIAYYGEDMRKKMLWEQEISSELKRALEEKQIRPYLQPLVDTEGKIVGAEALVRWIHPDRGFLSPASFIPLFERNGMIAELDKYMWRCACELLDKWKDRDLFISVNISPKDFYFTDVYKDISSLVKEYNIKPSRLRIEITESVMISDVENKIELVRNLQKDGFIVEMDDFGSGYSSLNMLKNMPIDVIKIDMAFLQNAKDVKRTKSILRSIINMSEDLGIVPLTEGVETKEQYEALLSMGCKMFQGYYFAKPMPVEEFENNYLK